MQIILIQIIICYTKQLVTDITDDTSSVLQIIIIHIVLENIVMCFRNHVVGFDTSARNKCDRGYNSLSFPIAMKLILVQVDFLGSLHLLLSSHRHISCNVAQISAGK